MKGVNYREIRGMPYVRREYIKGKPQIKIARFASGQAKGNYDYLVELTVTERIQIRHNSLEAARLAGNKTMAQAGDMSFFSRLRVYPHVILRENKMIATAGADDKLEKAKSLGADEVVNYRNEDWPQQVRRLTNKRGVDVVFEHTGAATWAGSIAAAKNNASIVTCGATSGYDAPTDLRQVFYRHLTIMGSFMGTKAELLEAMKFVERGQIRAVVDQSLPLAEARRAHELMEDRAQFGKLVLIP